MKLSIILSLFLSFALVGCASRASLYRTKDYYLAVSREASREAAVNQAQKKVEETCKDRVPTWIKEETQYKGAMDESTRNAIRGLSRGAMFVGGYGRPNPTSRLGTVGFVATNDKDYETRIEFECR